jgi:hypothetical protein
VEKRIQEEIHNRAKWGWHMQCSHIYSHIQKKVVEWWNNKAWNKCYQAMQEWWGPLFKIAIRGNEAVDVLASNGAWKSDPLAYTQLQDVATDIGIYQKGQWCAETHQNNQ